MLHQTSRYYHVNREELKKDRSVKGKTHDEPRQVYGKGVERIFNALLEGGKSGVAMGLDIIPGVLVICTLVMLLTFGPGTMPRELLFIPVLLMKVWRCCQS